MELEGIILYICSNILRIIALLILFTCNIVSWFHSSLLYQIHNYHKMQGKKRKEIASTIQFQMCGVKKQSTAE